MTFEDIQGQILSLITGRLIDNSAVINVTKTNYLIYYFR